MHSKVYENMINQDYIKLNCVGLFSGKYYQYIQVNVRTNQIVFSQGRIYVPDSPLSMHGWEESKYSVSTD